MNEEVYRKSKDDFDLFAELDTAYREDFSWLLIILRIFERMIGWIV